MEPSRVGAQWELLKTLGWAVEPSLSLTSSITICSLVTVELPLWPICYEVLIRAELIPVPWPEFPEVSAK